MKKTIRRTNTTSTSSGSSASAKPKTPDRKKTQSKYLNIQGNCTRRSSSCNAATQTDRQPNPKRRKIGVKALQETEEYKKSYKLLMSEGPFFMRLLKDILCGMPKGPYRMTDTAIKALKEAAELHLLHLFESSILCARSRECPTISVEDMREACQIMKRFEEL